MKPDQIKVLLVEDDEDDYILIRGLLANVPGDRFRIEWVRNFDAGINAIQSGSHDVCLLDYHLGDRDGLDLLRVGMKQGNKIPIILLTGTGDYAVDNEAMQSGAADFLVKSQVDSTLLERSIRYAVSHRRLEEQVRETSRLASIGQLAAGVAHEINNPLTSIVGYCQLLMAQKLSDSLSSDIQTIYCEAQRAAKIVQNLLLFARKTDSDKRYLDIAVLLERAQELMSYDFKASNINVIKKVSSDLPKTMVDEYQIVQVFLNILANAEQECRATNRRGQLAIRARTVGDRIRISISDDGPGITPLNLNQIFEPFFTTKEVGKGTGLGLSICYGIIRQHGGDLWAESDSGNGATFHIELPIWGPENQAETPIRDSHQPLTFSPHLLVVDDEPLIRSMLAKFLELQHFDVELAEDGGEAWVKLQSMTYDCILLDLKMPGMGGKELYRLIQASDSRSAQKVIFITGDTVNPDTRDFIEGTKNPVMTKPFELEDLHLQVLEVLG